MSVPCKSSIQIVQQIYKDFLCLIIVLRTSYQGQKIKETKSKSSMREIWCNEIPFFACISSFVLYFLEHSAMYSAKTEAHWLWTQCLTSYMAKA